MIALLLLVSTHVALGVLNALELTERQFNEWSALIVGSVFFEIVIWDMFLVPLSVATIYRCNGVLGMKLFRAMTLPEGK